MTTRETGGAAITQQHWQIVGGLAICAVGILALGLKDYQPSPHREDSTVDGSEFDRIVSRLNADYPSLSRRAVRPWPRWVLLTAVLAGVVSWGLLSIAMVAWGLRGVALTLAVVSATALVLVIDVRRRTEAGSSPLSPAPDRHTHR